MSWLERERKREKSLSGFTLIVEREMIGSFFAFFFAHFWPPAANLKQAAKVCLSVELCSLRFCCCYFYFDCCKQVKLSAGAFKSNCSFIIQMQQQQQQHQSGSPQANERTKESKWRRMLPAACSRYTFTYLWLTCTLCLPVCKQVSKLTWSR